MSRAVNKPKLNDAFTLQLCTNYGIDNNGPPHNGELQQKLSFCIWKILWKAAILLFYAGLDATIAIALKRIASIEENNVFVRTYFNILPFAFLKDEFFNCKKNNSYLVWFRLLDEKISSYLLLRS